jgi:hypothetical protein
MSVFIGSTTPSQRACLSKEFKKLYAKKTFIPRKQKIAIALNTCDVGIKGVKESSRLDDSDLSKTYEIDGYKIKFNAKNWEWTAFNAFGFPVASNMNLNALVKDIKE